LGEGRDMKKTMLTPKHLALSSRVSRTEYVALEVKARKLSEENKKLRQQRSTLRMALRRTLKMINDVLKENK